MAAKDGLSLRAANNGRGLSACNNDVVLDSNFIKTMGIAYVFHGDGRDVVNSMSYFADGEFLVTSKSSDCMILYNALARSVRKKVSCSLYGVDIVRYTHHQDCVIHTATKDYNIRYHSFIDNAYLRKFAGHTSRVSSLAMSPSIDIFMSASEDKTVRMWDLRSPRCTSVIEIPRSHLSKNSATFDPTGAVFAVCAGDQTIRLFDARKTDGPFLKFPSNKDELKSIMTSVSSNLNQAWCIEKIIFNPDGDSIVAVTNTSAILQFDSFDGKFECAYSSHTTTSDYPCDASFSPDGNYLAVGSGCGSVFIYANRKSEVISTWTGGHIGSISAVAWNPHYEMVATAYMNTVFWQGPAVGA